MRIEHEDIAVAAYYIWLAANEQQQPYDQDTADANWYEAEHELRAIDRLREDHPQLENLAAIFTAPNTVSFYEQDADGPYGDPLETFTIGEANAHGQLLLDSNSAQQENT